MGRLTKLFIFLFTLAIGGYLLSLLSANYRPKNVCLGLALGEKQACLRKEFSLVLQNYGVNAGFELLTFLYEKDSDFPPVCHDYTHLIGEEAYIRYSKGERFKLTSATAYCGYGFYHGFIVSLFKVGKGKDEASDFCSWANKELSEETNTTSLDCYHGVGHGMVDFNFGDISATNFQAVLGGSLNLCEEVGETAEQLGRCVNGVYHSLFSQPDITKDVFATCAGQPKDYRPQCFSASSSFIMEANNNNFLKSALLTQEKLAASDAALVVRSMAGYEAYRSVNNQDKIAEDIKTCKSLTLVLKEECIRGLVEGITDFGTPNEEEAGVKSLCEDAQFTEEEKRFCFGHAVDYFKIYFGEEKKEKLCRMIDEEDCMGK